MKDQIKALVTLSVEEDEVVKKSNDTRILLATRLEAAKAAHVANDTALFDDLANEIVKSLKEEKRLACKFEEIHAQKQSIWDEIDKLVK